MIKYFGYYWLIFENPLVIDIDYFVINLFLFYAYMLKPLICI